ncbi:hypothetical protein BGX38DRAFT_1146782 [Terfezia claveryi]|nr:hypothetical protein BGX38DRAFT_1146782 [Terfezia claveryi]
MVRVKHLVGRIFSPFQSMHEQDGYLTELDYAQDRETELESEIGILTDQVKDLPTRGDAEKELVETKKRQASTVVVLNETWRELQKSREELRKSEKEVAQLRLGKESERSRGGSRKILVSERKKWQAKGKALPVETVSVATQSDYVVGEIGKAQVEVAVQTETEIEKKGVRDTEDVVMADRSDMYEDLSGNEDEDEAPVAVAPLITKKQAALRPTAKAGKKTRPANIPPQKTPPNVKLAKAACQRPMADLIQDLGVRGFMGARWLLGGNRRFGN